MMGYRSEQKGVTLLELLVVIAVAAILAVIAMPSMSNFVRDNQLTSTRIQLVGDLNMARSEAIKRNTRVLICSGTAAAGCINSADWAATGWLMCYDVNKDSLCDAGTAADTNPFVVRDPIRNAATGIVFTGPTVPVYYNPIGTQGAPGNAGVQFDIAGNWSGYTGKRTVNVSTIGNITSH